MSKKNTTQQKSERRQSRHCRVRAKISGTASAPRLCVFRSNRHIFAQLIDDKKGRTLAACDDAAAGGEKMENTADLPKKQAAAFAVGLAIAKKAREMKIARAVFDRGGYRYHGRVKMLAEGARKGGLEF